MTRILPVLEVLIFPVVILAWLAWFLGSYYILGYTGHGIVTTGKE